MDAFTYNASLIDLMAARMERARLASPAEHRLTPAEIAEQEADSLNDAEWIER